MKTLFILILAFILNNGERAEAAPSQVVQSYNSCVIPSDSGRQGGQSSFTFYNSCNERLYINVCANDAFGPPKLYKSFKAVPVGGRYTIYTFPDMRVNQLQWVAGPVDPGVPSLCTLPKKGK